MPDRETTTRYAFGPYTLLPQQRLLHDSNGRAIPLGARIFDLLWYLVRHRGRLVDKAELLEALWPDTVVEENNLNQAVSALRQTLDDDPKAPRYIATVKGRGYQFVGEVRDADPPAGATEPPANGRPVSRARLLTALLPIGAVALLALYWLRPGQAPAPPGTPILEQFANARLHLVTDYDGSHSAPTLSPDGRMVAYLSGAGGESQIWIKNLQRGNPVRITDGPYGAGAPTWSPQDEQILFSRKTPDGTAIYSVGTLGKPGPVRVIEHATAPKYALRDDAFVYANGGQIWIARNDGRDRERIIGIPTSQGFASRQPALSPDGKLVAFVHAAEGPLGNIWLIPASGGSARQLTTHEAGGGYAGAPTWSSDGRHVVYHVNADSGSSHLWQVDIESGKATALTSGPGGAANPTLSADGTRLAYTTTRLLWHLSRIDATTAERSNVVTSREQILLPIASPDGRTVVFFSVRPSGMHLFTVAMDGTDLRQLTFDEPGKNALPTWAGDGESILYYRDRSLHRINPADGTDEQLFADFHWSSRNWLAASADRISYHNVHRPTGMQRTVVRNIGESEETELPVPIEAARWSPDGTELVGFFRRTGDILICRPGENHCENIEVDNETVRGSNPVWSNDGKRINYLRSSHAGQCCVVWRVNRDGSRNVRIAELPGFDIRNSYFGIDANDDLFYNHVDRSSEEIWLAVIDD